MSVSSQAGVQGLLDGMPRRLYPCTPTRLLTWFDCPRRYRFTYLDRPAPPKGPPWAHTSLGTSVHTALASWWRLPPRERTAERGAALVRQGWVREGYRDDAQSGEVRERAPAWVRELPGRRRSPDGTARCRAHRLGADDGAGPVGPGGPDRRAARRQRRRRRLQDRPAAARGRRRARQPRTGACTPWRPPAPCAGPAPSSSCTTCRAAASPPRATAGRASTARWPRRSRSPARPAPPTRHMRRATPGRPRSRPGRRRCARGATSGGCARRAGRRHRNAILGTRCSRSAGT